MKVTGIEVVRSAQPVALPRPVRAAWHEPNATAAIGYGFSFCRVYTDEGIVGIGPCGSGDPHPAESLAIGQDPRYLGRYWDSCLSGRHSSYDALSLAGLEIALWDIIGKAAGMPVYQLLGASRDQVMAYAATSELLPAVESAALALDLQARGLKAIKLRLHRQDPEEDLDVVRAVRDAVGSGMRIMVDANQNNAGSPDYAFWSRRTALRVAEELERLDVFWLEEPLPRTDLEGLAEIRTAVDVYIAGGEHCQNVYEVRDALSARAYDIVQPDVILGSFGISGIRKASVLADAAGALIVPHVCGGGNNGIYLAATLQALGTIAACPFIEYTLQPPALTAETLQVPLKDKILVDGEGYVAIPHGPGIGVEIDEDAIAPYI